MNALQTIRTAIARRLSTTAALGLLALTLAASGTLPSLQSGAPSPLGGDCLSMRVDEVAATGNATLGGRRVSSGMLNAVFKDDGSRLLKDNDGRLLKADEDSMGVGAL